MDNIEILNAKKKDLLSCAEMFCEEYNNNILKENWSIQNAFKLFEHYLQINSDLFYVAKIKHSIVGFICAYIKPWSDGNHLMLEEVCVKKEFRNRKIGSILLNNLMFKAVKDYHITAIKAVTFGEKDSMPFLWYKKLGFNIEENTYHIFKKIN